MASIKELLNNGYCGYNKRNIGDIFPIEGGAYKGLIVELLGVYQDTNSSNIWAKYFIFRDNITITYCI